MTYTNMNITIIIFLYIGSAAYVHLSCLNRWRETSNEAHLSCSICKYAYNIKKTYIADLLMSENGAVIFTVIMLLLGIIIIGIVLHFTLHLYLNLDIPATLFSYLEIHPTWRYCSRRSNLEYHSMGIYLMFMYVCMYMNIYVYISLYVYIYV
jgi:hypothetical protein